jgi:hypothetical protein
VVALRRVVTPAMPPLALDPVLFGDYQQLKRFFYLFGSGTRWRGLRSWWPPMGWRS